jgi:predicted metal-binding membrane protein
MTSAAVEILLRRDRIVVAAVLIIVTLLAWAYVLWLAVDMDMGGMDMTGFRMIPAGMGLMAPAPSPWMGIEFAFVLAMWAVMMIGMMLPSAAPMILIYARISRQAAQQGKPFAPSGWFAGGYVASWVGFSVIATFAQWALDRALLLTPMMASTSQLFGGIVLICVGLYQWTPLKSACLAQCQSPLFFIQQHGGFRRDVPGSLKLGLRHGAYCVGCCWALMTLLFVGGVMNVLWIAAITIFVFIEKVAPARRAISSIGGLAFVIAGIWLIALP